MDKIKQTMTAVKIDDFTLSVTKQPPTPPTPEPMTTTYDRGFLEQQLKDIQTQWDTQIANLNTQIETTNKARQAELDEVTAILSLMDENNITVKPIVAEPIMTPPIKVIK